MVKFANFTNQETAQLALVEMCDLNSNLDEKDVISHDMDAT